MVYVTSQPVHPLTLDYYLHLLAGVPASHARARLTMLCTYDGSSRPLTQKILERPRLLQRIRYAIHDREHSYLTVFNSTPLERRLSVLLGIPLNGLDPALSEYGTKSGSRRVFREAGVDLPAGFEDLNTRDDVVARAGGAEGAAPRHPPGGHQVERQLLGRGQCGRVVPARAPTRGARPGRRPGADAGADRVCRTSYFDKLRSDGRRRRGVHRGRREDVAERAVPHESDGAGPGDLDARSDPGRRVGTDLPGLPLSRGAANTATRSATAGRRIGEVLARHDVVSRYGVDFLAWRNAGARRTGASPRSRSTCGCSARRTRFSRSAS